MTKLRNSYTEDIAYVLWFARVFQTTKESILGRSKLHFIVETSGWFNSENSAFRVNLFQLLLSTAGRLEEFIVDTFRV